MAKVTTQSIPSELRTLYEASLGVARLWKGQTDVRKRYPWRLPHMQGNGRLVIDYLHGNDFTYLQFLQRQLFVKSCDCFGLQPITGGAEPPDPGPRNRSWWYDAAGESGLWYYDYFIQQTINEYIASGRVPWCEILPTEMGIAWECPPVVPWGEIQVFSLGFMPCGETQGYIKNSSNKTHLIHFYCLYYNWDQELFDHLTVQFHETTDDWDNDTLTWNNRPAKGTLLYEKTFSGPLPTTIDDWIAFEVPGVKSCVMSVVRPAAGELNEYQIHLYTMYYPDYVTYLT